MSLEIPTKLNIYVCRKCRGHVVTRDLDEGVTPFMIECFALPGCEGMMQSSMYRVFQDMAETLQWRKPVHLDHIRPHLAEHVAKGGLLLYRAGDESAPASARLVKQ